MTDEARLGRPIAIDRTAVSASPTKPAFIAPPAGAPAYHGFDILDDVTVDGFTLGKITDFEAAECDEGDAFVLAPDGSRAGLVWEVCQDAYFVEVLPRDSKSSYLRRFVPCPTNPPLALRDNPSEN